MNNFFSQTNYCFFGKVPFGWIEERVYFFFTTIEGQFSSAEFLFCCYLLGEELEVAVQVVSDVFEEGVEVLFDDLELSPDEVAPLNRHVVQCNVEIIEFGEPASFRYAVEYIFRPFVQLSKEIPHFVECIYFVSLYDLQCLPLPSDLLVKSFHFWYYLSHFLEISLIFQAEVNWDLTS